MATKIKQAPKPYERAITNFNKENLERFSPEALKWYRDYVAKNLGKANPKAALKAGELTLKPKPGYLYTYQYDPKTKETLPFYDTFPLILCIGITPDGWYGINFHYIAPRIRAAIFEELMKTNSSNVDENIKIRTNWKKLSRMSKSKYISFACKRYLGDHILTPLCKIDQKYWEIAIFLPIARFEKSTNRTVWGQV